MSLRDNSNNSDGLLSAERAGEINNKLSRMDEFAKLPVKIQKTNGEEVAFTQMVNHEGIINVPANYELQLTNNLIAQTEIASLQPDFNNNTVLAGLNLNNQTIFFNFSTDSLISDASGQRLSVASLLDSGSSITPENDFANQQILLTEQTLLPTPTVASTLPFDDDSTITERAQNQYGFTNNNQALQPSIIINTAAPINNPPTNNNEPTSTPDNQQAITANNDTIFLSIADNYAVNINIPFSVLLNNDSNGLTITGGVDTTTIIEGRFANSSLAFNADTQSFNYRYFDPLQSVPYSENNLSFQYTASDGSGNTTQANVTFNIQFPQGQQLLIQSTPSDLTSNENTTDQIAMANANNFKVDGFSLNSDTFYYILGETGSELFLSGTKPTAGLDFTQIDNDRIQNIQTINMDNSRHADHLRLNAEDVLALNNGNDIFIEGDAPQGRVRDVVILEGTSFYNIESGLDGYNSYRSDVNGTSTDLHIDTDVLVSIL